MAEILLLMLFFISYPSASGQPAQPASLIPSKSGNSLLITNTGSPGDFQFLIEDFLVTSLTNELHNVTNIENVIGFATVDGDGFARFTASSTNVYSFFRAATIASPALSGQAPDQIKIFSFPEDAVTTNNGNAAFMVIAEGTVTNVLQYQWFKNDVSIAGATNSTLILNGVTVADDGSILFCDVNMLGHPAARVRSINVAATGARLSVPTANFSVSVPLGDGTNQVNITAFPQDVIVTNGGLATFTVQAQSTIQNVDLQYQWFKNDVAISPQLNASAVTPSLSITNAHFTTDPTDQFVLSPNTDVGFYACRINMQDHPPVWARTAERGCPGARLIVYTGSDTSLYAPYQGNNQSSCIGSYSGYVKFKSEKTQKFIFNKPAISTSCTLTDITVPNQSPYHSKIWFSNADMDSCTRQPPVAQDTPVNFTPTANPYQLSIYIVNAPFPTGAQFGLKVDWGLGGIE